MRGVITENALLLKHKTKTITAALNREKCPYFVIYSLEKIADIFAFYCHSGHFVSRE